MWRVRLVQLFRAAARRDVAGEWAGAAERPKATWANPAKARLRSRSLSITPRPQPRAGEAGRRGDLAGLGVVRVCPII